MTSRGRPLSARFTILAVAAGLSFSAPGSALAAGPGPGIVIDPDSGPAGTTIKVVGSRFCPPPCTSVTIKADNLIIGYNIRVNAKGGFTTFVEIPGGARATQVKVTASQQDTRGATSSASGLFYVTPELPPPVYYPPPTGNPALPAGAVTGPPRSGTSGSPGTSSGASGSGSPTSAPTGQTSSVSSDTSDDNDGLWLIVAAGAAVAAIATGAVFWRRRYRPAH